MEVNRKNIEEKLEILQEKLQEVKDIISELVRELNSINSNDIETEKEKRNKRRIVKKINIYTEIEKTINKKIEDMRRFLSEQEYGKTNDDDREI